MVLILMFGHFLVINHQNSMVDKDETEPHKDPFSGETLESPRYDLLSKDIDGIWGTDDLLIRVVGDSLKVIKNESDVVLPSSGKVVFGGPFDFRREGLIVVRRTGEEMIEVFDGSGPYWLGLPLREAGSDKKQ